MSYLEGYKVFDSDFKTFNGMQFREGMHAHTSGPIKAGAIDGHGFHLCLNIEDVFRYAKDNPVLCEVIGFGEISHEYTDEYNGYYDIYACSDIYIKRVVPRQEIIEIAKDLPDYRLERLIGTYKMTDLEINEIISSLHGKEKVLKAIRYYHFGDKNAYKE